MKLVASMTDGLPGRLPLDADVRRRILRREARAEYEANVANRPSGRRLQRLCHRHASRRPRREDRQGRHTVTCLKQYPNTQIPKLNPKALIQPPNCPTQS